MSAAPGPHVYMWQPIFQVTRLHVYTPGEENHLPSSRAPLKVKVFRTVPAA